jgi:hypothetical protein
MNLLEIGKVYRYSRPYNSEPEIIDGLHNYFHVVFSPGKKLPLLEAGINPIAKVHGSDGDRCPALLISSSPHKIGSFETPWQDTFDPDYGYIRYLGDNQMPGRDPEKAPGNAVLLREFALHNSPDPNARKNSTPILFFRRITYEGRTKGNVVFQGFGIIQRAELITQYHLKKDAYFTNYVFECAILNLKAEGEKFNWDWITSRRNSEISLSDTLPSAPNSWRLWIKNGPAAAEKLKRKVSKLSILKKGEQQPSPNSREHQALSSIYNYYSDKKARFEALASLATKSIISRNGTSYKEGWITPPSGDHGADFIGRVDLGSGSTKVKIVVLGQAKCESLNVPTGGNHIVSRSGLNGGI